MNFDQQLKAFRSDIRRILTSIIKEELASSMEALTNGGPQKSLDEAPRKTKKHGKSRKTTRRRHSKAFLAKVLKSLNSLTVREAASKYKIAPSLIYKARANEAHSVH